MDREEKLRRHRISSKKYYSKPNVKIRKRIYKKQYDLENKKKNSEYGYKLRAKPEYKERIKLWREKNKEHLRLFAKAWRKEHSEEKKLRDREYSKKIWSNPILRKKEIERETEYRKTHPEKVKLSRRKYNQSPKGKLISLKYNNTRQAHIKKNKFSLTPEQLKQILERDKVCVYCGNTKNLTYDHIISVSKEGNGEFNNIVVACKKCNSSKNSNDVYKWCELQKIEVPKIVLELIKLQEVNK